MNDYTGNKSKVAIVCVGYNRKKSIERLFNSLLAAEYSSCDIPLVISIDASKDEALYEYVKKFHWPFGEKYVNIQTVRLGLENHIYQCGDLTAYFKAVILLEDDLCVSRYFYKYILHTIDFYAEDNRIAEISLYKNEINGYVGLPFENINNGSDVFLMQDVSTWGECWTESMWNDFTNWRCRHTEEDILNVDMPVQIKKWTRAWSKCYNAYVVDTGKFVLYPNVSLTTNFSDAGEHGGDNNSLVQVNLLQEDFDYRFLPFEDLAKYDIYFNNVDSYEWLHLRPDNLCLDYYGFNNFIAGKKYLLSTRVIKAPIIKSFALNMRPIELNVKNKVHGSGIFLYDVRQMDSFDEKSKASILVAEYFLRGFNMNLLRRFVCSHYIHSLLKRLHIR